MDYIHRPNSSPFRLISHSRNYRPFETSGPSGGFKTPGYNRFGFAVGPESNSYSSSSSSFANRRGDSLSSSSNTAYDRNRKGYDRGVDDERLYRPITIQASQSSSSSGLYGSGNKGKYSGSRYGTPSTGSSSPTKNNQDNDYRLRPHPYEGLSSSSGNKNDARKDLTLSEMLDMSSTNGDNLDLQHKMQIHDFLYSNSSRANEDARQLSGLYVFFLVGVRFSLQFQIAFFSIQQTD